MIEKSTDTSRRLPPFVGAFIGAGAAWAAAEIALRGYNDLLHVAVALGGLGAGWLVGIVIAATIYRSKSV
jgi:hypothetical protein